MKRVYGVLLAACLLLTACGETISPGQEDVRQPPRDVETDDLPEQGGAEQSPAPTVPALPPVPADPWRDAYAGFLEGLAEEVAQFRDFTHPDYDPNDLEGGAYQVSGTYMLYDIDKSGIPELLIRYGLSEASYHTSVYGFVEDEVVLMGDIGTGHTNLYSWPGENGLAYNWAHMGGHFVDRVFLEDGKLMQERFFEEGLDTPIKVEYVPVEELLPGSIYLRQASTYVELPILHALTLPIYDYGVEKTKEVDVVQSEAARNAIEAVLQNGTEFYAVSADGFGGDAGWTTMGQYLQPGGITDFADWPMELAEEVRWADLNGDGQEDALLTVRSNSEEDLFFEPRFLILAEQDGVVYGYCLNYMGHYELQDGVFVNALWEDLFAVSFYGPQIYRYTPGQEMP